MKPSLSLTLYNNTREIPILTAPADDNDTLITVIYHFDASFCISLPQFIQNERTTTLLITNTVHSGIVV